MIRYEHSPEGILLLVAPCTLIVGNSVLSGNKGPLYYPIEEVQKSVDLWNGTPIVVSHPMENGCQSQRVTHPS